MQEAGIDLWITPASAGPAPQLRSNRLGRHDDRVVLCRIAVRNCPSRIEQLTKHANASTERSLRRVLWLDQ